MSSTSTVKRVLLYCPDSVSRARRKTGVQINKSIQSLPKNLAFWRSARWSDDTTGYSDRLYRGEAWGWQRHLAEKRDWCNLNRWHHVGRRIM